VISKIIVPDLGATGGDVILRQWLVQPGQRVEAGQALFLVETDKATVEVESFVSGVVRALLVEEETAVPLGAVVAILADSMEEALPIEAAGTASSESGQPESEPPAATETEADGRIMITPLARRMAQAEGLDLGSLSGSGRLGQILKRDIEGALAKKQPADVPEDGARRQVPSTMRQAIARTTLQSKTQAPHFYANISVDMDQAKALLKEAAGWAGDKGWPAPTLTDICLRATALTLSDFPSLNAAYGDEEILYFEAINIGLVVGLEEGMVIPVIHEADRHNLYSLAAITGRLKERALKGTLSGSELSGGTFSLTNLGMYGLDSFTAVINPPQAGILALGAVREVPLIQDGAVVPGQQMTAVLSADHRLVDGIVAARFMAAWKEMLEHPYRLALEPPEELNL